MSYYVSDPEALSQITPKDPSRCPFKNIDELYNWLNCDGWCKESAYADMWNPENKCAGQCNATAILVRELFGGKVIKYKNPVTGMKAHFFNRFDSCNVDLTSDQFPELLTEYSSQDNKDISLKKYMNKYTILKQKLQQLEINPNNP